MSKRQEIRERRRKVRARNRVLVIGLVVLAAALITFALVIPGIQTARDAGATLTAANANLIAITPRAFSARVDGRNLGDPNAPVKVVAYEDFRCSGCKYYSDNIEPEIIQNYVETGRVYYTYAVYIIVDKLDYTDASRRSANAALCAAAQKKFWEFHDTLYANQVTESAGLFTDARLARMAENVGLDLTAFDQCYQAKQYDSEIESSNNEAVSLGITGTPSVFVNGTLVKSYSDTIEAIDAALAGD